MWAIHLHRSEGLVGAIDGWGFLSGGFLRGGILEGLFATVDSLLTLAVGFYDAPLPVALGHALDGGALMKKPLGVSGFMGSWSAARARRPLGPGCRLRLI